MVRSPRRPGPLVLVVVVTAALGELLRVSFPLLYALAEDIGFLTAAAVVPLLFALPLLAAPVGLVVSPRLLLVVTGVVLGLLRGVAQVQATPGLVVVMAAVVAGLVALPLALRSATAAHGPVAATGGLFVGLALDAGIRLAFVTWDVSWQTGPIALVVGLVVAAGVVAATVAAVRDPRLRFGPDRTRTGLVVGPVLALQTLALASPAFVASASGLGLGVSGAVVVVGLALAAGGLGGAVGGARRQLVGIAAIVVVATAAVFTGPTAVGGPGVVVLVLAAQWAVGVLVVATFVRATDTSSEHVPDAMADPASARCSRTGLGAGIGSLVLVIGLLPYQISYELPLGVPQAAWPVLAALVLVGTAVVGRPLRAAGPVGPRGAAESDAPGEAGDVARDRVGGVAAMAAVAPVLAVPVVLALTAPAPARPDPAAPAGEVPVRVATYNLHSGVGVDGRLDPERIARVLEDGGAEVMALQEVARGWPLAGGIDLASWLSRRLGSEFVYGPAADRQFGNAVLSTRPILASRSDTMPRGEGPMRRGWVAATVPFASEGLEVFSIHLQHQDDTTATRRAQARQVLDAWDGAAHTVLAGDFNSRPDSPDIEPWFDDTGLASAQDSARDPARMTSPAAAPDHRIDWVLGTGDLAFSDVAVPATTASDHLPIFADVLPADPG